MAVRRLVNLPPSSTERFRSISAETVSRTFELIEWWAEQRGIRTVDGRTAVTERAPAFVLARMIKTVYATSEVLRTDGLDHGRNPPVSAPLAALV